MRGVDDEQTAQTVMDGLRIYYNFMRPHMSLGGKTPAQAARMDVPNNWKGLIEQATRHEATLLLNALSNQTEENQDLKVVSK